MQQLTLFSGHDTPAQRRGGSSRGRKKSRPLQISGRRWDLWAQEAESEREMALFFLDIRDFTPLAERHHASDIVHIVRKLFSTFQHIIKIHHGRIIETSGDGFYAAFGFDCEIRAAVGAAVRAGYAILGTLERLNTHSLQAALRRRIEVGIGIHAGRVATGSLHLGSTDHLVIMGYPVNVASRLQAATKEFNNNFIVSHAVFSLLESGGNQPEPIVIRLRGLSEPCSIHLIGNAFAD